MSTDLELVSHIDDKNLVYCFVKYQNAFGEAFWYWWTKTKIYILDME